MQSGRHLLSQLEPPVDDDVEREKGKEGKERGAGHPGPGGVPHDVILELDYNRILRKTAMTIKLPFRCISPETVSAV